MKITFLGTNGWYSTKAGDAICTLIETEKFYLLFDAGEGFYKADKYVTEDLPVYLFLSHLHFDHIYGLHILPRMPFKDRLTIVVPENKLADFALITKSPFTASLNAKISVLGSEGLDKLPFPCECRKLKHQDDSLGYKLNLDGKTLAYCLDTGYCEESVDLARNSDVLIHECTNNPDHKDGGWGHSCPEEAARVAKEASVKKLILTHFMPDFYPNKESRKEAQRAAKQIFENSISAMDNSTIEI